MNSILPVGIGQILSGAVESARLELNASWDPTTTGGQVLKTLCAFANDLQNLNGGYIVIGVEERNGTAVRPVRGLAENEIDAAQRWIQGHCNQIEPTYMPVFDTPEIDGQRVLVLWAPASDHRPHQAPDGPKLASTGSGSPAIRWRHEMRSSISSCSRPRASLSMIRLAEGRGTGIPKIHRSMRENGSPLPSFDFDERELERVSGDTRGA